MNSGESAESHKVASYVLSGAILYRMAASQEAAPKAIRLQPTRIVCVAMGPSNCSKVRRGTAVGGALSKVPGLRVRHSSGVWSLLMLRPQKTDCLQWLQRERERLIAKQQHILHERGCRYTVLMVVMVQ